MPTAGPITDQGIQDWLVDLQSGGNFANMRAHLYVNNVFPSDSSLLTDFVECSAQGYAPLQLTGWGPVTVTGHVGSTTALQLTFTFTGSYQPVYGVYFTNSAMNRLYGAVRDPNAPVPISGTVNTYLVTVTVTSQSLV